MKLDSSIKEAAQELVGKTPVFLYDENKLTEHILKMREYESPFGLRIRFAMKANPNLSLIRFLNSQDVWIDASTSNECYRAIAAGVSPEHILLTSQEVQKDDVLKDLVDKGVEYNACSLTQLRQYGELFPNTDVSIRFNTGRGSSYKKETSTGGKGSSFGIYGRHQEIKNLLDKYNLTLSRVHIHIGSAAYKDQQVEAMKDAIEILKRYPTVHVLNMGGGFKVARVEYEPKTDIKELSAESSAILSDFCKESGRKIDLEIEPGTALIANAGFIITKITDVVDTGSDEDSMSFIKVDTGMTMNTRVALYGAQNPIEHIPIEGSIESLYAKHDKSVVVGECCESADIVTCEPNKPGEMREEEIRNPKIGDLLVIGGVGAYCAGMSLVNYNSKQQSAEYFLTKDDELKQIRKKQKLEDVWQDDILIDL